MIPRTQIYHLAALALCLLSLAFAYLYLERSIGLEPCPLCILDRIVFIALAVIFALAYFQRPGKRDRIGYDIGALAVTGAGLGIAGRHVYLQTQPADALGDCGAGFWYLLDQIGMEGAVASALRGTGDCGEIQWTLFGLSIPMLTLTMFGVIFLLSLTDLVCACRSDPLAP